MKYPFFQIRWSPESYKNITLIFDILKSDCRVRYSTYCLTLLYVILFYVDAQYYRGIGTMLRVLCYQSNV